MPLVDILLRIEWIGDLQFQRGRRHLLLRRRLIYFSSSGCGIASQFNPPPIRLLQWGAAGECTEKKADCFSIDNRLFFE